MGGAGSLGGCSLGPETGVRGRSRALQLQSFKAHPETGFHGMSNANLANCKCRISQLTSPSRDPCQSLRPDKEAKLSSVLDGTQHSVSQEVFTSPCRH